MFELFYMGGPLFMSILTLIFLAMLVTAVINFVSFRNGQLEPNNNSFRKIGYIKQIGLFALIVGVLGQLIGLFSAFEYIEQAGSVSPEMLAGGIKVSMITTLYGLIICTISYLIWLGMSYAMKK